MTMVYQQTAMTDLFDWSAFTADAQLLAQRRILVTGAGDGIGRALSQGLAACGATVILLGRTQHKLEQVYDAICQQGGPEPVIYVQDLNSLTEAQAQAIAAALQQQLGGLDGVVHNAALLGQMTPLHNYDVALWQQVMQVNLTSSFMLTRALLGLLQQAPQGRILFTSSSVGRQGRAYWGAYAVSKFAVEGLMQVLADELEQTSNIRVNCINPGATATAMRSQAFPAEDPHSLPRADSLLPCYLYLLSAQGQSIQGQSIDAQRVMAVKGQT